MERLGNGPDSNGVDEVVPIFKDEFGVRSVKPPVKIALSRMMGFSNTGGDSARVIYLPDVIAGRARENRTNRP